MKQKQINIKEENIFTYDKLGTLYLGGLALTEKEIKNIQEEIAFIEKTRLWEIWQNTLKKQAIDVAFFNSKDFDDVKTGKAMVKNLGILQDINNIIKSWRPRTIPNPAPLRPIDI